MERMIAFCGIDCSKCDAFLAKKENYSLEKRKAIAEKWAKEYGGSPKAEDIACDGCTSEGEHFKHCRVCGIRLCGRWKGVKTCAQCNEYPCQKLSEFWKHASSDSKANLDSMRR
jgi:hypothetical protein